MAQLAVPEKFTADLQQLALEDHRPVEALVDEALLFYLSERLREPPLTSEQKERLKRGMEQARRGELVSADEVDAFFDDWEREAASRRNASFSANTPSETSKISGST